MAERGICALWLRTVTTVFNVELKKRKSLILHDTSKKWQTNESSVHQGLVPVRFLPKK